MARLLRVGQVYAHSCVKVWAHARAASFINAADAPPTRGRSCAGASTATPSLACLGPRIGEALEERGWANIDEADIEGVHGPRR